MSNRQQLFLDCDGVLADFDSYAEKVFGLPSRKYEDTHGTARFWADLQSHPDFYRKLPLMPDARELFDAVKHLNPIILTGCPQGGWAEAQKQAWAAHHFPGTHMITCMSKDKRNHMLPGDVLVDDWPKYRELWEEAGGVFVLHTSAKESIRLLQEIGILKVNSLDNPKKLPRRVVSAIVSANRCANCLGDLDTEWECYTCGYGWKAWMDESRRLYDEAHDKREG